MDTYMYTVHCTWYMYSMTYTQVHVYCTHACMDVYMYMYMYKMYVTEL